VKPSGEGSILHLPLRSSGVSDLFAETAELNGYHTIAEIISIPLTQLIKMSWITPAMWEELAAFIEKFPPSDDVH
jgi:hypothetical protein